MDALWILGDQLLPDHPLLQPGPRKDSVVVFLESSARGSHYRYHRHKLVLIYSAMRHYSAALHAQGWTVFHHKLEDGPPEGDFSAAWQSCLNAHPNIDRVLVMEPNDYDTTALLPKLARRLGRPVKTVPTTQFLVPRDRFRAWAGTRKSVLMEQHYRKQRQDLSILVGPDGEPEGGAWNFDHDNRKTHTEYTKAGSPRPRTPIRSDPDPVTRQVIRIVQERFPDHPGDASAFWLPVTRDGALDWLDLFIRERLGSFGPYEDLMDRRDPFLFHSVLSPLINIGLLTPRECVQAALKAYEKKKAPLASVEGFVRQIIGWREFINGIYWWKMPGYRDVNALGADRPLPAWIRTGETDMACLRHVIRQAIDLGYNHHIERLMVLGNFFLLGGYRPADVLRWYQELYVDAYDWVMLPNVYGMILYADGGLFATKPYAAGSGYISRMSNHCAGCRYKPAVKTGPEACPFNYLYWNFFGTHRDRFARNPRIGMMIKTWDKKTAKEQQAIRREADAWLDRQA